MCGLRSLMDTRGVRGVGVCAGVQLHESAVQLKDSGVGGVGNHPLLSTSPRVHLQPCVIGHTATLTITSCTSARQSALAQKRTTAMREPPPSDHSAMQLHHSSPPYAHHLPHTRTPHYHPSSHNFFLDPAGHPYTLDPTTRALINRAPHANLTPSHHAQRAHEAREDVADALHVSSAVLWANHTRSAQRPSVHDRHQRGLQELIVRRSLLQQRQCNDTVEMRRTDRRRAKVDAVKPARRRSTHQQRSASHRAADDSSSSSSSSSSSPPSDGPSTSSSVLSREQWERGPTRRPSSSPSSSRSSTSSSSSRPSSSSSSISTSSFSSTSPSSASSSSSASSDCGQAARTSSQRLLSRLARAGVGLHSDPFDPSVLRIHDTAVAQTTHGLTHILSGIASAPLPPPPLPSSSPLPTSTCLSSSLTLPMALSLRDALRRRHSALHRTHEAALEELRRRQQEMQGRRMGGEEEGWDEGWPEGWVVEGEEEDDEVEGECAERVALTIPSTLEPYWYERGDAGFRQQLRAYKRTMHELDRGYFK